MPIFLFCAYFISDMMPSIFFRKENQVFNFLKPNIYNLYDIILIQKLHVLFPFSTRMT